MAPCGRQAMPPMTPPSRRRWAWSPPTTSSPSCILVHRWRKARRGTRRSTAWSRCCEERAVTSATIDTRQFRSALGSFTTGVTIVTTRDRSGQDIGLTVNSFSSVSLEPPLVLWSLAKSAASHPAFLEAKYFAVHILAADQEQTSNRFSQRGADKFLGLQCARGHGGIPLLEGCAARFECASAFRHEGGDHE